MKRNRGLRLRGRGVGLGGAAGTLSAVDMVVLLSFSAVLVRARACAVGPDLAGCAGVQLTAPQRREHLGHYWFLAFHSSTRCWNSLAPSSGVIFLATMASWTSKKPSISSLTKAWSVGG